MGTGFLQCRTPLISDLSRVPVFSPLELLRETAVEQNGLAQAKK
jgi:hypothetical protein